MASIRRALWLEDWSRNHALVMLGACAAAIAIGRPWPVSCAGLVSFGVLVVNGSGAGLSQGASQAANLLTGARLLLVAALGLAFHGAPDVLLATLALLVFVLDGLDGFVARKTGAASPFGARFDMETDAFFVLAVTLELWQRGRLGAWILVPGLLRYVYVLCLASGLARAGEMPRSQLTRFAFGVLVVGLCAALATPNGFGTAAALFGSGVVCASFARSFYWSYAAGSPTAP